MGSAGRITMSHRSTDPVPSACGTWTSPIGAQMVAAAALRLGSVSVEGDTVYWVEGRPGEGGRNVIVKRSADGRITDATPERANVRTRVHEYGGAAYAVSGGTIYYVEFTDQRLYKLAPGAAPVPLTPPGEWFYADFCVDAPRGRLLSVREDHTVEGREAVTTLVSVPISGPPTAGQVVFSGHDFYSTPRLSSDSARLSWLAWRHPQMPWDGTELWMADLSGDGSIERPRVIAGGEGESIFQPGWSPDGTLYFVSDRTGWWNLYRLRDAVEPVHPMDAELGRPQWQIGASTWAFADASRLVVSFAEKGRWHLATLDVATGAMREIGSRVEPADSMAATATSAVLVGGSTSAPDAVVRVDLASGAVETLRASSEVCVDSSFLSPPEAIEFPTDGGLTAHAFYYPPRNPAFTPLPGERPPLIVVAHGGPTAAATPRDRKSVV